MKNQEVMEKLRKILNNTYFAVEYFRYSIPGMKAVFLLYD